MVTAMALVFLLGADDAKNDASKDLDKLQGDWVLVSSQRNGKPLTDEQVKAIKRTIKGNEQTVTRDGQVLLKGTIKVDPTKKPKTIDVTFKGEDGEERILQGIYEVDGDQQKVCYTLPGNDRPTDFSAAEGSERTMSVWKKEKK
jgi:uncharacterized protein (TIGR03067 family)